MKRIMLAGIALLLIADNTWADNSDPSTSAPRQTETWLQLQASGRAASPTPQVNTAAERDLSLQRWLETYKYKIPEFYDQEAGGSFSSGKK
ncbi:DUF3613 domain-containing protein [Pseudomonas syringae]|uniref:DUF3613 domain-containing protein n=2 Tax=Pseudomonas syringae group TaxID=136849 RepID=A0A9Q4A6H0_PSESX|nr:DUF3613 domain-containing protein [Pseudomonas syringae]KTB57650.1 hypothetical protein AO067_00485 [Pseudomonas viridiflava ICMP 13104]KTB76675.1 hypothetical protein AO070_23640 [Pseudomonas syringae pv. syringae PD2766]MCF5466306.1 DUF3613 domain-containing protein [Pseudomonas syringae]MCF5472656.1 DUF3613 domain-containing protein [Pseudomonas syringae]MCF5481490.1 DUF3613 domain-containing protein [Pseudomonas syringae]